MKRLFAVLLLLCSGAALAADSNVAGTGNVVANSCVGDFKTFWQVDSQGNVLGWYINFSNFQCPTNVIPPFDYTITNMTSTYLGSTALDSEHRLMSFAVNTGETVTFVVKRGFLRNKRPGVTTPIYTTITVGTTIYASGLYDLGGVFPTYLVINATATRTK